MGDRSCNELLAERGETPGSTGLQQTSRALVTNPVIVNRGGVADFISARLLGPELLSSQPGGEWGRTGDNEAVALLPGRSAPQGGQCGWN